MYGLKSVVETIDKESNVTADSTKHTNASYEKIVKEMVTVLKGVQAFSEQPGRMLLSFPGISKSQLDRLNVTGLHKWLTHNKKRLFANAFVSSDDVDDDDEMTEQNNGSDSEQLSESEDDLEVSLV